MINNSINPFRGLRIDGSLENLTDSHEAIMEEETEGRLGRDWSLLELLCNCRTDQRLNVGTSVSVEVNAQQSRGRAN